jgi:hypothetical protein
MKQFFMLVLLVACFATQSALAVDYTVSLPPNKPTEVLIYFHGLFQLGARDLATKFHGNNEAGVNWMQNQSIAKFQSEMQQIQARNPGVLGIHINGYPNGWGREKLNLRQIVAQLEKRYGFKSQQLTIAGCSAGGYAVYYYIKAADKAILLDATYKDFSDLPARELKKIYMIDGNSTKHFSRKIAKDVAYYRQNVNLPKGFKQVGHGACRNYLSDFYLMPSGSANYSDLKKAQ